MVNRNCAALFSLCYNNLLKCRLLYNINENEMKSKL